MRIQKRTMNWLPRPPLYKEQAALRAKQRVAHQQLVATQSSLASAVSEIRAAQTQGAIDIASTTALQRIGYRKTA